MLDNRRQFPRFEFDKPVQYQPKEGADSCGALASDISLGGIKITINEFVPLGSVLELGIHIAELGRQVMIKSKVVWIRENTYSERFDIGLEFVRDEQTISLIESFLNKRQRK
jgi:c-di-GMP-binding flagellar brake protein YcgR